MPGGMIVLNGFGGIKGSMEMKKGHASVIMLKDHASFNLKGAEIFRSISNGGKKHGVYISAALPIEQTMRRLAESNADTEKVIFIDTKNGVKPEGMKCKKFYSVSSPSDLTGISIALSQALGGEHKDEIEYIYLDSFSEVTSLHESRNVEKFSQYLVGKIRGKEMNGAIVVIGKNRPEHNETICTAADSVTEY